MDIDLEEGEVSPLPDSVPFSAFVAALIRHNQPISHRFGTGYGVRLQRMDSDLALDILAKLEAMEIVGLPVHDSFIVQERHAALLRNIMQDMFLARFGASPRVRTKRRAAHPQQQAPS